MDSNPDVIRQFPKWISVVEIAAFYALVHFIIWFGDKYRPTIIIVALLAVALCVFSNIAHKDSLERVGLQASQFFPALKTTAAITIPLLIPLFFFAIKNKDNWPWNIAFAAAGYPIWGFAQEYVLLAFINNRLEDVLPSRKILIPWFNAFLFSLAHIPNPVLMLATFVAGYVFTWIFHRHRHLLPIALAHALFGIGISLALGHISGVMSVGPGYLARVGEPLVFW